MVRPFGRSRSTRRRARERRRSCRSRRRPRRGRNRPGEIGQLAIRRDHGPHVIELELLDDVGHPVPAEGVPGEHVHAARAEQRPERDLHRAGVRGGTMPTAIAGRQLQQLARLDKRKLEPRFRLLGPVVAAEQGAPEIRQGPAGVFGAGAGREARIGGLPVGFGRKDLVGSEKRMGERCPYVQPADASSPRSRGPGRAKNRPSERRTVRGGAVWGVVGCVILRRQVSEPGRRSNQISNARRT